jgi:hypothetical protein
MTILAFKIKNFNYDIQKLPSLELLGLLTALAKLPHAVLPLCGTYVIDKRQIIDFFDIKEEKLDILLKQLQVQGALTLIE